MWYPNEGRSKETFIDGWVRTGDEVMVDNDGNFFVTDRIKVSASALLQQSPLILILL
jgi:long-subunit acyl-CoA synthetase (AMP-forming)